MSFPDTPRSRTYPYLRRVLRPIAWTAASLLLFLAVALVVLHTAPARRYVLARAQAWLASQHVELEASRLRYNLLSLSLQLDDVTVRARGMASAPPLVRVEQVTLDLGLLALLSGRYVVEDGALVRPVIHVAIDRDGRTNIPVLPESKDEAVRPAPAPDAGRAIDYLVRSFRVTDLVVHIDDRRRAMALTLPVRSIAIEGARQPRRHDVRVDAGVRSIIRP
jgi:uncharacterized protein involved in outer membrane biogenesis